MVFLTLLPAVSPAIVRVAGHVYRMGEADPPIQPGYDPAHPYFTFKRQSANGRIYICGPTGGATGHLRGEVRTGNGIGNLSTVNGTAAAEDPRYRLDCRPEGSPDPRRVPGPVPYPTPYPAGRP
jgi:hypothetical protein